MPRQRHLRKDESMTRFVVVPQWQGSPSSRAMQLIDGAHAIHGDLPRAATTLLDVPMEAGESLETGVQRYSALRRIRGLIDEAVGGHSEPLIVVGGDCGVAVGAIAHARRAAPNLAVVWVDAHPDLNTPESSPSGAFAGMALSAVLGDGPADLIVEAGAVPASRVVLAAARSFDASEDERVGSAGIPNIAVDALADPAALADAVRATGADAVYVHIDVDALDPAALAGNAHPEPFGVSVADLAAAIRQLRTALPLVGASIAGYSPASPAAAADDLGAILRLVGALA